MAKEKATKKATRKVVDSPVTYPDGPGFPKTKLITPTTPRDKIAQANLGHGYPRNMKLVRSKTD